MKIINPIYKKTSELKCPFCGKVPTGRMQDHMRVCIRKNNIKYKDYKEITAQVIIYNWPEFKNKEYFVNIYNNNSIPDFQRKYGTYFDPRVLCYYYNIHPRSCKDAGKMGESKRKKFYEDKYGEGITNSLSKGTPGYNKRNATVLKKYGVDNVFRLPEVVDKIWNGPAYPEKYGCTRSQYMSKVSKAIWDSRTEEEKIAYMQESVWKNKFSNKYNQNNKGIFQSSLEAKVVETLVKAGVPIETQFCLKSYKVQSNQHVFFYDILIKNINVLLEINGNFWHANPEIYKVNDLIEFPGHQVKLVSDIWDHDKLKKEVAEDAGYKLIYIWESEIKSNSNLEKLIENKLREINENIHFKE